MPLPRTPRSIWRAILVAGMAAIGLASAICLIAMPDRVLAALDVGGTWAGWLRGLACLQLAVVGLTLRRTARSTALLMGGGVLVVPVLAAAIRAQPVVVAALLVVMAIGWCRYLDGKEREAAWEGRRF